MKEQKLTYKQLMNLIKKEEKNLKIKQKSHITLQNTLRETLGTIEAINEIEKNPEKVLIKIGSGIMISVKIENTKKILRSFSQNEYLLEDIKDAKKWLNIRKKEIESQITKSGEDIIKTQDNFLRLISIAKQINDENKKLAEKNIATK